MSENAKTAHTMQTAPSEAAMFENVPAGDMRAYIEQDGKRISEVWNYVYQPQ